MRLRALGVLVVAAAALIFAACGLYDEHPYALPSATAPAGVNLLQDASFEDTGAWTPTALTAFSIDGERAYSGIASGELRGTKAGAAASQPLEGLTSIPEFVSGYYRLDDWKPVDAGAEIGFRMTVRAAGDAYYTLHFVIGGPQEAPAGLPGNEAYVFLSRAAPATGGWRYFGYPVAAAFKDRFGLSPAGMQAIELGIELRGEGTQAWFDDVYAGTQAGNPNRPSR